jgi:alpha/beta superfamily hydrolase
MDVVLLHPHPDHGGNQHHPVFTALADLLPPAGFTPHRFDFRSSDLDVARQQAVDALGEGPTWLVGYSFGGGIAALVDDPRVAGWYLIAPALYEPVIGPDPRPKAILAAGYDHLFSPQALRDATADWVATEHFELPGADHQFRGRERLAAEQCVAWLA